MGKLVGGALRIFTTLVYFLAFCCAAIALGIYSYFLAKLSYHHLPIINDWRAVEGLAGAGVVYTIFAVILTVFLGGVAFFAFLGIVLNFLFCGAFIAIAVLTRRGSDSCSGVVYTPLGVGQTSASVAGTNQGTACRLNKAVFGVAIAGAILFAVAIFLQLFVARHHQKEKKYGPSPANNYTSGSGNRRFWKRKGKPTKEAYGDDVDMTSAPGTAITDTTHTTGQINTATNGNTPAFNDSYNKYDAPVHAGQYEAVHGGYAQGAGATSVNPYGYESAHHPTGTAVNY